MSEAAVMNLGCEWSEKTPKGDRCMTEREAAQRREISREATEQPGPFGSAPVPWWNYMIRGLY